MDALPIQNASPAFSVVFPIVRRIPDRQTGFHDETYPVLAVFPPARVVRAEPFVLPTLSSLLRRPLWRGHRGGAPAMSNNDIIVISMAAVVLGAGVVFFAVSVLRDVRRYFRRGRRSTRRAHG